MRVSGHRKTYPGKMAAPRRTNEMAARRVRVSQGRHFWKAVKLGWGREGWGRDGTGFRIQFVGSVGWVLRIVALEKIVGSELVWSWFVFRKMGCVQECIYV